MKLIQSFAAVLLLSSAGTAVASPVTECKSTIEARLTASTVSRLQQPQDFQLRSVGWFVNDDQADTYSMVIYYTDTATDRRGMTTATVLATNKQCRLLSSNFFLFERR